MRRRFFFSLILLLMSAAAALAGGGPQNVLVVYNPQFPWSQAIAQHYQAARHIPADNMFALSLNLNSFTVAQPPTSWGLPTGTVPNADDDSRMMLTVTDFTNSIYNPIVNYLAQKGLTNQVYMLVLCEGVPWRMWSFAPENADLKTYPSFWPGVFGNDDLGSEAWVDTALARFSLSNLPPASLINISDSNNPLYPGYSSYYSANDAFQPGAWSIPTYTASSGGSQVNAPMPFLVSMLYGYFAGNYQGGQNLVNDAVDRGVAADAAFPTSTFLFLKNDDAPSGLRSCRSSYYWIEAETMRQKGFGAFVDYVTSANLPTYQPWLNPGFTGSVMGVTMGVQEIAEPNVSGTAAYAWSAAYGWPWANGAYAETLTSFGGYYLSYYQAQRGGWSWWHTTPECFLAGGACGGFGTAKEPGLVYYISQLMAEFPLPLQFRRYADGFSYAEVMYQSVAQIRNVAIVGDPLGAPFAKRPAVAVAGLPAQVNQGAVVSAAATALHHPRGKSVQRLEAYLDGHFLASFVPACPAGNTVSVTLSGQTVSYTTTSGETRSVIFAQLQNAINAAFSNSFIATATDLAWYDNIDTADLALPPNNGDPQGNPTSGQLMLLTQLRGPAGNGFSCAAALTASAGQNFARPAWLAPATYGGTQWANPMLDTYNDSTNAYSWAEPTTSIDDLEVLVINNPLPITSGGETLTISFSSADLAVTASGVVTLSDTIFTFAPIQAAIAQEMAALSAGQYSVSGTGLARAAFTPSGANFLIQHPAHATSGFLLALSVGASNTLVLENSGGNTTVLDNVPAPSGRPQPVYVLTVSLEANVLPAMSPGTDLFSVQFFSSDGFTTGSSGLVAFTTTTTDPSAAAVQIAQVMARISSSQYVVDYTGSGVQAAGRTPASTFIFRHPTAVTSPFIVGLMPAPLPPISPDSSGTVFAQTSNGGPGLNYLYLDLGPDTLSHTFTFDTTALALGAHELQIVGVDGGAAEAQGYAYVDFQLTPATLSVTPTTSGSVFVTPSLASYTPGTPVQIVATPSFGYVFAGWFVNSGTLLNYLAPTTTLDVTGGCVLTASFVPATLSVTASASANWVYQNTPVTTADRHQVALTLSVTDTWGNHSYTVTVVQDGAAGVVTPTASWSSGTLVTPTGSSPVVWTVSAAAEISAWLVGGRRQSDGYADTGPCTVTIQLVGDVTPAQNVASAQLVLTVCPLGDINGDGDLTTADRVQLRQYLNGLPAPGLTAANFRLDGDAAVTAADLALLNSILNNLPVP